MRERTVRSVTCGPAPEAAGAARGRSARTSHGALTTPPALAPLAPQIKAAFVYGSVAKKEDTASSDIDLMLVSELSRLGRSVGQIIQVVDSLVKNHIRFVAIKENIQLNGQQQDIQSKVMVTMFGLFAEIERDLISERTREGLAAARAKGNLPGRPKGSHGRSRLDGKEAEIRVLIGKQVSKTSIAKIMDVSRSTVLHFIRSRALGKT